MLKRLAFAIIFAVLFMVELLIALLVADDFVRPYLGDVIAVAAVYFFMRIIFPEKPKFLSPIAAGVGVLAELLQLTPLSEAINSEAITILIGGTFDVKDLLCYAAGGAACFVIDFFFIGNKKRVKMKK